MTAFALLIAPTRDAARKWLTRTSGVRPVLVHVPPQVPLVFPHPVAGPLVWSGAVLPSIPRWTVAGPSVIVTVADAAAVVGAGGVAARYGFRRHGLLGDMKGVNCVTND